MARKKKTKQLFEAVEITGAGSKGKSIAKAPDGKVIFVKNAVPGDVADIQTYKKRRAFYEGEAVNIVSYSDKRVEPECQHFGTCGGCKWQNMGYEHQLAFKENEVINKILKITKCSKKNVIYIGDSLYDYVASKKAKIKYLHATWGYDKHLTKNKVITKINRLSEIRKYFDND